MEEQEPEGKKRDAIIGLVVCALALATCVWCLLPGSPKGEFTKPEFGLGLDVLAQSDTTLTIKLHSTTGFPNGFTSIRDRRNNAEPDTYVERHESWFGYGGTWYSATVQIPLTSVMQGEIFLETTRSNAGGKRTQARSWNNLVVIVYDQASRKVADVRFQSDDKNPGPEPLFRWSRED